MVEAATDRTYEGPAPEQVYGPLGLREDHPAAGDRTSRSPTSTATTTTPPSNPPRTYSELIAAGWSWASGGIVSTPSDLNDFIRGYVGGDLFDRGPAPSNAGS